MINEELEASELGTQDYWNKIYKEEVGNFRNHKDVGEVWFGEDISSGIVTWMDKNVPKTNRILDIGCGNGLLLVELSKGGYEDLTGMDYSEDAIVLAKEVSASFNINKIEFNVNDVLKEGRKGKCFDNILDKGTYDAISLMVDAKDNRKKYIENVYDYLRDNGLLIITSCNWTKDELIQQFDGLFSLYDVIPTPQFKFGGKIGSVVSSVILKKINK